MHMHGHGVAGIGMVLAAAGMAIVQAVAVMAKGMVLAMMGMVPLQWWGWRWQRTSAREHLEGPISGLGDAVHIQQAIASVEGVPNPEGYDISLHRRGTQSCVHKAHEAHGSELSVPKE